MAGANRFGSDQMSSVQVKITEPLAPAIASLLSRHIQGSVFPLSNPVTCISESSIEPQDHISNTIRVGLPLEHEPCRLLMIRNCRRE